LIRAVHSTLSLPLCDSKQIILTQSHHRLGAPFDGSVHQITTPFVHDRQSGPGVFVTSTDTYS